jgi:predicted MFS family arabinose efflux permease
MVTMTAFAARIPQNTDVRIVLVTASCLVSAGFLVNSLARRGWTSSIARMLSGAWSGAAGKFGFAYAAVVVPAPAGSLFGVWE